MSLKLSGLLRITMMAGAMSVAGPTLAAAVMPDFADAPTGWITDRYAPASFGNVGTYQGRDNVLGIGIDSSTDSANRGGLQSAFYNTQGKQHAISGGAGSLLAADLFVEKGWSDASNGLVRTDMWGFMGSAPNSVSAYTIIGFTNQGSGARLRIWDADVGGDGWVNLATSIAYDTWVSLAVEFDGDSFNYYVNGALAYADGTINGTTGFLSVAMQAYNFAEATFNNPTTVPYVARWSNASSVPEPGSLALVGLAVLSLGAARRRKPAQAVR